MAIFQGFSSLREPREKYRRFEVRPVRAMKFNEDFWVGELDSKAPLLLSFLNFQLSGTGELVYLPIKVKGLLNSIASR